MELVQVKVVWVVMVTHEHASPSRTAEAGDTDGGQVLGEGG